MIDTIGNTAHKNDRIALLQPLLKIKYAATNLEFTHFDILQPSNALLLHFLSMFSVYLKRSFLC